MRNKDTATKKGKWLRGEFGNAHPAASTGKPYAGIVENNAGALYLLGFRDGMRPEHRQAIGAPRDYFFRESPIRLKKTRLVSGPGARFRLGFLECMNEPRPTPPGGKRPAAPVV
jgi:hypothetical protein